MVNVWQIFTVDKRQLGAYFGTLSPARVQQILAEILLVVTPGKVV